MRDLSRYPIGIVPSHVWRRATPAASKPAQADAMQADQIPAHEKARQPHLTVSSSLAGQGGARAASANRSSALPPASVASRRVGGHPLHGKSAIRPEAAERYAALFKLVREVRDCWRECPSGECRRHRRCVSAKYECCDLHRLPRTPEEEAAILADFHRALQRRLAELRAEEQREER